MSKTDKRIRDGYSAREVVKLSGKDLADGLKNMFNLLLDKQLKPVVDAMIAARAFKPLRGFADLKTQANEFHLEILGFDPVDMGLTIDDDAIEKTDDSAHYEQNLIEANKLLLTAIIKEMMKQNITGKATPIVADSYVAVIDFGFVFQIRWSCKPAYYDQQMNTHNN